MAGRSIRWGDFNQGEAVSGENRINPEAKKVEKQYMAKSCVRSKTGQGTNADEQTKKYLCSRCNEQYDIKAGCSPEKPVCPRCGSQDVDEFIACKIDIGPPPWEYVCNQCHCRFSVQSPSGPDEARSIKCPACASGDVKWLALTSEACPPGG